MQVAWLVHAKYGSYLRFFHLASQRERTIVGWEQYNKPSTCLRHWFVHALSSTRTRTLLEINSTRAVWAREYGMSWSLYAFYLIFQMFLVVPVTLLQYFPMTYNLGYKSSAASSTEVKNMKRTGRRKRLASDIVKAPKWKLVKDRAWRNEQRIQKPDSSDQRGM